MAQVVQAKCPHCQTALRIPAEWLDKPMRCKHCKQVFQARSRATPAPTGVTAAPPAPAPRPATGVTAKTPAPQNGPGPAAMQPGAPAAPFAFDDEEDTAAQTPVQRPAGRKKGAGRAIVLVLLVLALVGVPVLGGVGWFVLRLVGGGGGGAVEGPGPDGGEGKRAAAKVVPVKGAAGGFPRRALFINVNNYLLLNPLLYGSKRGDKNPGSSTRVLKDQFQRPPLYFPEAQIFELSDTGKTAQHELDPSLDYAENPHTTQKSVLEKTIEDFLATCRDQDRAVILFAGHACDIEKDSYLIPIEGDKDDPKTLIPLKWVYDRLAACKARQKVLILDVFRYSPSRGFELPGAGDGENGEMGEVFDQNLQAPPAGVQVWSACVKGQASIELEGSAFLQALNHALTERGAGGFANPTDPLPVEDLVGKVNKRLKELLAPEKKEQTSRLTGRASEGGAEYDPAAAPAPKITLEPPAPPPGGAAGYAQVDKILDEIRQLPPVRETRSGERSLLKAANLPLFKEKALAEYKADGYKFIAELRQEYEKDPDKFAEKYPVRAAVFDSVKGLEASAKISMKESLTGPITPQIKTIFLKEQQEPGMMIFELEKLLGQMKTVAAERDKEASKRWQANFDYAMARLESRIVYLYEYSYLIARIRADDLPALADGQSGWRVGSVKKIKVNEPKAKAMTRDIKGLWEKIREDYPDTPWALLARRESLVALGLEWRPKSGE